MTRFHIIAAQLRERLNPSSERGITAVEYGLMLLGIASLLSFAAVAFGTKVVALYNVAF